MKLKGILSSKGRRAVHERNRDRAAPAQSMLTGHKPTPYPDGSLACSGCGAMRYSPAAFAAHLAGKGITDAEGSVYTLGPRDPWVEQQQPERQLQAAEADSAAWREEMIAAYWDKQRRRAPRVVAGVDRWITD